MIAATSGKAGAGWFLTALVAVVCLSEVSYRTLLTAKFGTIELQTTPVLLGLLISAVLGGYGFRVIEGIGARIRLVLLLLVMSIAGLLVLLAPGSPFPFLGVVYQPWGGYIFTVLLTAAGTFALRAATAKQDLAVPYPRAAAIAASGLALLTWGLALGGFSYLYANK